MADISTSGEYVTVIGSNNNPISTANPFPVSGTSTIYDKENKQYAEISRFGHLVIAPLQELAAYTFANSQGSLDLTVVNRTHTGNGTTNVGNAVVSITSGTTANTTEAIQGIQTAPFNTVAPNRYVSGLRLGDSGVAGNIRLWGALDSTQSNGHFFRKNGTVFEVVSRKSGVDTAIQSGNFNGNIGTTFDPGTTAYTYFIEYAGGGASYFVAIPDNGIQLLHSMSPVSGQTTVVDSLLFSARVENTNTTNTTSVLVEGRGQGIGRVGVNDADQLVQSLSDTTFAQVTKSVQVGRIGTNSFVDITADSAGRSLSTPTKGTYTGQAGVSGTVNVPSGAVVRSYAAQAGTSNATVTVPGVSGSITVPGSNNNGSTQFSDNPDAGTMVGPCTFVFSGTASFVVIWVV